MNPLVIMALIELGKVVVPVAIEVTPKILQAIADAVDRMTDEDEAKPEAHAQLMALAAQASDAATA